MMTVKLLILTVIIRISPWAKMQMSLSVNAEWKNFDFSMMWNGQFGNECSVSRWQGRLFADNSNYIRFEKGEEPYQVNPLNAPRIICGDFRNSRDADRFLENKFLTSYEEYLYRL